MGEEGRHGSAAKTIWGLPVASFSIQQTWVWPTMCRVLGVDWKANKTRSLTPRFERSLAMQIHSFSKYRDGAAGPEKDADKGEGHSRRVRRPEGDSLGKKYVS